MVVINFIQNYKKKFMFKLFNKKLNKIWFGKVIYYHFYLFLKRLEQPNLTKQTIVVRAI